MIQKRILMFDKINIHKSKWRAKLPAELAGIQASKGELDSQWGQVHKIGSFRTDLPGSILTMLIFYMLISGQTKLD